MPRGASLFCHNFTSIRQTDVPNVVPLTLLHQETRWRLVSPGMPGQRPFLFAVKRHVRFETETLESRACCGRQPTLSPSAIRSWFNMNLTLLQQIRWRNSDTGAMIATGCIANLRLLNSHMLSDRISTLLMQHQFGDAFVKLSQSAPRLIQCFDVVVFHCLPFAPTAFVILEHNNHRSSVTRILTGDRESCRVNVAPLKPLFQRLELLFEGTPTAVDNLDSVFITMAWLQLLVDTICDGVSEDRNNDNF